ncbi:MAG: alkaline phosphatase PhoX, partial [Thermomicrobiales bacterium]
MTTGRSEEFYEGDRDQVLSTAGIGETMQEVLARRWSRRGLVKEGLTAGLVLTAARSGLHSADAQEATPVTGDTVEAGGLTFVPIALDTGDDIVVASGHTAIPFLRWGDPLVAGAPDWDLNNQSAAAQEQQFGYNCDWIAYFPLPSGSDSS